MLYSKLLSYVPNLSHGFTTNKEKVEPEKIVRTKQVHGNFICWVRANNIDTITEETADGIATTEKGVAIGVQSADCCPILLCGVDQNYRALSLMALHAGWKGTAKQIAAKGLTLLYRESIKLGPLTTILVIIGPYISGANFEVGEEVKNAFSSENSSITFIQKEGKYLLDIGLENIRQISQSAQKIPTLVMMESLGLCTYTNQELLPSYRREPNSPRKIISYLRMHV